MKLPVLALAGIMVLPLPAVRAAPMLAAPATESLIHEADVRCAYLTEDGYCVRPHKKHQHWKYRHHYRQVYRTYEPQPPDEYYWRYQSRRPIIRIIPSYPRQDDDSWDGWDN